MKKGNRRFVWGLMVIGLILLCHLPNSAQAWERQYPPEPMEALQGVWASDAQNLYAIGSDGMIYRYDGVSWTIAHRRENTTFKAIWGFSPTDVFAAGSNGTVLYYNGAGWNELATGIEDDLTGIWGDSPVNLYTTTTGGSVYHFNGNVWTSMGPGGGSALCAIWGVSGAEVFVAGASGSVYRFDGNGWQDISTGDTVTLRGLWGVSGDLFAVGDGGAIFQYDGEAWTRRDAYTDLDLTAVFGVGNQVLVVGEEGTVIEYNGGYWQIAASLTTDNLTGLHGTSVSDFFISSASGKLYRYDGSGLTALNTPLPARLSSIGGDDRRLFTVGEAGAMLEYDGSDWINTSGAVETDMNAVDGSTDTGMFAVGAGGVILQFDGATWLPMESPTTMDLHGLFVAGDGTAVAVGLAGTVLNFDGDAWQTISVPTAADLYGVTGDADGRLVAVGSDGVILEYGNGVWTVASGLTSGTLYSVWTDGTGRFLACGQDGAVLQNQDFGWSAMPAPVDLDLFAMWGTGTDDLFAAGQQGVILHYNGQTWARVATPTGQALNGLWGGLAGVFAVGDAATILHQDQSLYQRLTITKNGQGSVRVVPSESLNFDRIRQADFEQGTSLTLKFTPASGYVLEDVRVDGDSVDAVTEYVFTSLAADHTVEVDFVRQTHTISASAGSGGIISPSGAVTVSTDEDKLFTFTPNTGYIVNDVLVDGVSQGAIYYYNFQKVQADHTISVSFTPGTAYTITPSAGSNGLIYPYWTVSVENGGSQNFYFTPASENYRVLDVLVDSVSVGAVYSYNFTNVTANHTIDVTFTSGASFTIYPSAGENGSISPNWPVSGTTGDQPTFTFNPNTGYRVSNVLVDGSSVGAPSSYQFTSVTADDHNIHVTFERLIYAITASTTNSAGGTETGGTISPSGSTAVNYGDDQTFNITPSTNYHVQDVLVDSVSVGAVTSYTFTNVTANHTIEAVFAPDFYTITASAGTGGSIDPSGSVSVAYGADQTFNITPDTGYDISSVVVDGTALPTPVSTYTFTNVTSAHTISATFTLQTFTITSSANTGGTISPLGLTTVSYSGSQTYTVTSSTGYEISDVLVDGVSVGAITSDPYTYTFTAITADHTIYAEFVTEGTVTAVPTVSDSTPTSGDTVTLDGSGSTPSSGLTYTWTQSSGTPTVLFYDETAVSTTFVAPVVTTATQLIFTLTVSDGTYSDSKNVTVTVQPSTLTVSGAPSDAYIILSSEGASIGVKVTDGSASGLTVLRAYNPASIGTTTNRPDDLPYGLVQLSGRLATGQNTMEITFYLPAATAADAGWYRYVTGTGWLDYTANVTFNTDYTQVTVRYTDNGSGDSDSTTGRITDLSGLGVNETPSVTVRNNSAGGGCFIGSLD